jgi:hypothetical protein
LGWPLFSLLMVNYHISKYMRPSLGNRALGVDCNDCVTILGGGNGSPPPTALR